MTFSGIYTKAAVLVQPIGSLEIMDDVMVPLPKRGQVLVRIQYAGLCHSQLMEIQGMRGENKYLPHMLGHEGVGKVIQVGQDVSKVKKDDQVILGWIKGKGLEGNGCQYQTSRKMLIKSGSLTTFSEYVIVSENRLVLKPPHTPQAQSVLYGCAIPTGLGKVFNS
ncbi:MAG: alcohol dehydrogenase [uncultured bacterium]|nr:MAG: alcohol dehydrogenase [uncultured bacterium]